MKRPTAAFLVIFAIASPAQAQTQPQTAPDSTQDSTVVIVQGKAPKIVKKIDRTVYNQEGNPAATSGSAADVLKTVPSVSVTPDGNVSLRGSSNVEVYVNGKPSAMMQGDSRAVTLQSMNGADIASVEVITNPSAAYNANGGGIINIVLKKDRKPGSHAAFKANVSRDAIYNSGLSGSYSRGRLSLNATVGVRHDGGPRATASDVTWLDAFGAATGRSTQTSSGFPRRASRSASFGIDYDADDRDTISLSGSYASRHSANNLDEFHRDYAASGTLTDAYDRRSQGPGGQIDSALNANFDRRQKDGGELKFGARFSESDATRDKSYANLFTWPVQPDTMDRILSRSGRKIVGVNGDYVRPLGETTQISAGFDAQHQTDRFVNYSAAIDPATGTETPRADASNRFVVDQNVTAAYVTFQAAAGKWTALGGLRLETVHTDMADSAHTYANLNPSLHLSYDIDTKRRIKASFTTSLQRPDPRDLDPFITYVDAQNVTAGNPSLKPQRVTSLEAGYAYTSPDGGHDYEATLYYRTSARTVTDYSYFTSGNVLLTTKRNSGAGRSGGVDISTKGKWGKLDYTADLNLFYAELQADAGSRQSGPSWTGQIDLEYQPNDGETFSLDAQAHGAILTGQGQRSGTEQINATWTHKLTKKINLVIRAQDILAGTRETFTRDTITVHQTGVDDFRTRRVFIGLVWRLGK